MTPDEVLEQCERLFEEEAGCRFQYDEFGELCDMDGGPVSKQDERIAKKNPFLIVGGEYQKKERNKK
jgi:hypothetical protein